MTPDTTTPAADLLRSAVGRVGLASATDGELVRRYADHRDDLAFAELVHRFAPVVYALCRRHLSDPGAADDAFQAVFVLLARKVGTLTHPDRVGGWLTGTADKVARSARRRQSKRSDKFRTLDSVPEPAVEPSHPSDLRVILDDELAKLPPHYRTVVTLCDVDGVSRREAATRLNIPTATLGNRLTRARAVLGRRLLRRGVLVAAGAVVSSGSVANPPARLLASAVRVALSDSPPTELLPLLIPEITPMPRGKLILLFVTGLVLAGGVTTGVLLLTQNPSAPPTSETTPPTPPPQTKPTTPVTSAVSVEEVMRNQPKPRLPQDDTGAFAFSPDGRWFVRAPNWGGQDAKLSVYDTASWKVVASIDYKQLDTIVSMVAISADGKRVFLSATGGGIRVWDVAAKKYEDKRLDLGGAKFDAWRVALTPDGKRLVGGLFSHAEGKGYFRVWDATTGDTLRTIEVTNTGTDRFCFTDGGKTVAAVGWTTDKENPTAFVVERNLDTGKETRRIEYADAVGHARGRPIPGKIAYTADGKHLILGGGFKLPDVPAEKMDQQKYVVNTFPYSGSVWVIDRETGKLTKTLIDHRFDLVRTLHLTADGKKVIVNPALPSRWDRLFGDNREFVELQQWDVATWELDWVKIVPAAERWKLWNGSK